MVILDKESFAPLSWLDRLGLQIIGHCDAINMVCSIFDKADDMASAILGLVSC